MDKKETLFVQAGDEYWVVHTELVNAITLVQGRVFMAFGTEPYSLHMGRQIEYWIGKPYQDRSRFVGLVCPIENVDETLGSNHGFLPQGDSQT